MRDIIISTTVCVACLLLALVSQIVAPSTVSAAPAQPAAVRSEACLLYTSDAADE